jgi:predicted acetyltransferase
MAPVGGRFTAPERACDLLTVPAMLVAVERARSRGATAAVRLRPPGPDDQAAFRAAHRTMAAEAFPFGLFYEPDMPWPAYLDQLEACRRGVDLPPGRVRSAFLLAVVADEIVGRASIRFELNDFLAHEGGHIGYCVLPPHRRRGHATAILLRSLAIARAGGVERVLVTCDDANVGSATVIERCGGVLESLAEPAAGGRAFRRYWID